MVVKLQSSKAFIMFIREKMYDIEKAKHECDEAELHNLPMYLVAPDGADITPLLHHSWRPDGVFVYDYANPASVSTCYSKIHADRKWIEAINEWKR